MAEAFEKLGNESCISTIILAGASGKAFIAGADIKEFLKLDLETEKDLKEDWIVTEIIENLSKPVIAMIDGFCLGGGLEIAMACDLRIASNRTKLGQPEINIGIIPGAGGTQLLPRLIGISKAKHLIFSAKKITSNKAFEYGLIDRILLHEIEGEALTFMEGFLSQSSLSIKLSKRSINSGYNSNLKAALNIEFKEYIKTLDSEDRNFSLKKISKS